MKTAHWHEKRHAAGNHPGFSCLAPPRFFLFSTTPALGAPPLLI
jgi:hypothetical protein